MSVSENYARIRQEIPDDVTIVVSCKTRTTEEIKKVIDAGATDTAKQKPSKKKEKLPAARDNWLISEL